MNSTTAGTPPNAVRLVSAGAGQEGDGGQHARATGGPGIFKHKGGRGGWLALVILGIGLLLTGWIARVVKSGVDAVAKQEFEFDCLNVQIRIEDRLHAHEQILRSGAAFFADTDGVTREEWREFAERQKMSQALPGIQGIGFARLVPGAQLAAHEQAVRAEGFADYRVWPAGERDVYSTIVFLEPFSGRNLRAFGYDMFTEPIRRAAMETARDEDRATLSGKVKLVQETQENVQAGTLMYAPVYRMGAAHATVAERRAALVGWVYSPYRMNDLMEGILDQGRLVNRKQLHLQIHDNATAAPSTLLYDSGQAEPQTHWTRQVSVNSSGRQWLLTFENPGAAASSGYGQVWFTLGAGGCICLLLAGLALSLVNIHTGARRLAMRLTHDLQETSYRLSLAVQAGGVGIWDYDVVNNRLVWDEQMFRLYGLTRETFGGAYEAWQAGLHPEDRQRGNAEIQLALQDSKDFDIEFRVLWPDGTIHNIRGLATVERDAAGNPLRMIGTNWDITAQKRAEGALLESVANFRTFFETMTDVILVGTPEGRILFANAAVTPMLGYTPEELTGTQLLDIHPAEMRQEAGEIFGAMIRGERGSCPLPLATKDGSLVPVDTRVWLGQWNGQDCIFGLCKNLSEEQEAKQRFERLFRSNPNSIGLSSATDEKFVDVNDAFLTTMGYAREEVLGKTSHELGMFVHPESLAMAAAQLQVNGRIDECELQVRRKDGAILDGLFSAEVISSQGQLFLLVVMVNITQRKRVEVELARLSQMQSTLLHLATEFVNVPVERRDAAIDESLATMGQLIGAERASLVAYDFTVGHMSSTHEWNGPGIPSALGRQQELLIAPIQDWVAMHRRGEVVHIPAVEALPQDDPLRQLLELQGIRSLITVPLMRDGSCLGFIGFSGLRELRIWNDGDIALLRALAEIHASLDARSAMEREARELQSGLLKARDAAQAAAVAKSLFLANMSHEIRTPLNSVLGYAQIMERECGSCRSRERLKPITRSGEHLLRLINDLLDLARADGRTIALSPGDFDFHQVLEDVRLMMAGQLEAEGLTLEVTHAPEVPQFINTDPTKLRQILVNLLGNAVKFTTRGGVRVTTSVLAAPAAETLTLAVDVDDSGCGIAEGELERVFDVFEQAEHGIKSGKGTGLGLPLSRRYAEALGGGITVTSTLGSGSRFRFTFNARSASGGGGVPSHLQRVSRLVPDQPPCRLLVVDDEPENRNMLEIMLTAVGFAVETAAGAAQALERLRQAPAVDLVLLDKNMPEMGGYEAIRHLRALPGGSNLPVVVVSASGFATENDAALAAGADGFIAKPVRREQLLAEIARLAAVRYEYETAPPVVAPPAPPAPLAPLDPAAMACLADGQLQLFDQALRRGDTQLLRKLIAEVAVTHGALAAALGRLVDAYDYASLHRLLDAAKGPGE